MNNVSVSREFAERLKDFLLSSVEQGTGEFGQPDGPKTGFDYELMSYGLALAHALAQPSELNNSTENFNSVGEVKAQPSEQPAKAEQPERCKHGVRWPHDCSDCEMELAQRMRAEQPGAIPANVCALCYHDKADAKECTRPDCEEQPGDVGLYEAANGALSMLGYLLNHLPEGSRDNTAYMNLREELKSRGALRHGL